MSIWRWPIDISSTLKETMRVTKIQFGDGYVQRIPDGINTELYELSVKAKLTEEEWIEARPFLVEHKGTKPIEFFDHHTGNAMRLIVEEWTVQYGRGPWVEVAMQATRDFSHP